MQPWMKKRLLTIQSKLYVTSLSSDASNRLGYARRNSTWSCRLNWVRLGSVLTLH